MKKFAFLAAVLGLTLAAHAAPAPASSSAAKPLPAGINAVGYDANLGHVTARLGLSENNALDLGLGLNYDNAAATDAFQLGLSGYYLLKLQDWGMVDNHLALGGDLAVFSDSDARLRLFGGLQPEVTLLDRIIVSIRFGAQLTVAPDFALATAGQPIDIVRGLNFKIIW